MRWHQPGEYVGPALVLYLQFGIDRFFKNEHVFMTGETFEDGEFIQTSAESAEIRLFDHDDRSADLNGASFSGPVIGRSG